VILALTLLDKILIDFTTTKAAQEMFMQLENTFGHSTTAISTVAIPSTPLFPDQESQQNRDTMNHEPKRKVKRGRGSKEAARRTGKKGESKSKKASEVESTETRRDALVEGERGRVHERISNKKHQADKFTDETAAMMTANPSVDANTPWPPSIPVKGGRAGGSATGNTGTHANDPATPQTSMTA
jgi:hypothetical protein